MGSIHYWRDYLKCEKDKFNISDYIFSFYINNENMCNVIRKYYSFNTMVEMIRFVKYIALPSLIYSTIKKEEEEVIIEAIDYREMLNFFTINDNYYDKLLIKKYSQFYNKLEECEYSKCQFNEFENICNEMTKFFSREDKISVSFKYYDNFKSFEADLNKHLDDYVLDDESKRIIETIKLLEKNNKYSETYQRSF